MIHRAKHPPKVYSFTCDRCSVGHLETEMYSWDHAMMVFRSSGWVVLQPPGQKYLHFCPDCARDVD
jgi:hypothetical protein